MLVFAQFFSWINLLEFFGKMLRTPYCGSLQFLLCAQVDVNGPETHPVYRFLKQHLPASQGGGGGQPSDFALRWNFCKFVVDRSGFPVRLFPSAFDAVELEREILRLLETEQPATQ